MSWFSCDVEADGPIPGPYSMISFGAVLIDPLGKFNKTFYGELAPISNDWVPEALAVSGFSREQTLGFPPAIRAMEDFNDWLHKTSKGYPILLADNNGFDWQFINWYFHKFTGDNPFGFSSRNLNDIYHGLVKDARKSFKHLRFTKHDHNPVNDAKGNAEAFLYMVDHMGFKAKL